MPDQYSSGLSRSKNKAKQNKTQDGETVSDQRILKRHDNAMQCYIFDWILEQKEGITGKTGEIQMKSRASLRVRYRCWFLSSDDRVMVRC